MQETMEYVGGFVGSVALHGLARRGQQFRLSPRKGHGGGRVHGPQAQSLPDGRAELVDSISGEGRDADVRSGAFAEEVVLGADANHISGVPPGRKIRRLVCAEKQHEVRTLRPGMCPPSRLALHK